MRDDRGHRFKMVPDAKKALADSDSPVCVRAETLLPWPIRVFNILVGIAACIFLFVCLFSCIGPWLLPAKIDTISDYPGWIAILILLCFVAAGVGGMVMPFYLNFPNRWNRRAAKEIRWCMRCAYSLEGISAEADGCTVCPECGAAWELPEQNEHDVQAGDGAHSG